MRLVIAVLAAVLIGLAGCGEQTAQGGASEQVIGTGKTADYDFTATELDGSAFQGESLKGKPAVLWFWAPWCPTCRAQAPAVSALAEEYDGRVAVIGVGGLDSESAIRNLAVEIQYVTHLVDDEGVAWQHFQVTAQSTYTVIGADGEIKAEGYLDNDQLAELVASLAG
jgi:thiol-disulfide isomerase/thioredoxin